MKELDYELLKKLYCIHSKSGSEKKMRRFIKRWISDNVPSTVVTQDNTGNLYITKGDAESYPCLCAHMDQVQDFHPKDFTCIETDDVIMGYSPKMRKQCGLGADDKNGIFIALSCLQKYDILKCAFFAGEEIGCVGSSAADIEFFNDCRFCAQIDRRGNDDMITSITSQMCSEEFYKAADPTAWGYKEEYGLMTDVEVLRENGVEASCINMSCGYYEPHTDREFTSKQDLEKCYAFVCHLIEDCTAMFPFEDTLEYAIKSRYGYVFEEDELYDMISEIISTEPYITFDEFYLNYGCSFDKINKERQRDMFFECKSFYNFGN